MTVRRRFDESNTTPLELRADPTAYRRWTWDDAGNLREIVPFYADYLPLIGQPKAENRELDADSASQDKKSAL